MKSLSSYNIDRTIHPSAITETLNAELNPEEQALIQLP